MRIVFIGVVALGVASAGIAAPRPPTFKSVYKTPAWSHDGSQIAAFRLVDPGEWRLVVMNADGTGQRVMRFRLPLVGWPSWSPDDGRIAFDAVRRFVGGIWTVGARGGRPTRIATGFTPSWSTTGLIAYCALDPATIGSNRIYAINPNGTGKRVVAESAGNESYCFPSWAPDGRRVVVTVDTPAESVDIIEPFLGIAGRSGHAARHLVEGDRPGTPAWSPLGGEIAFTSFAGAHPQVSVLGLVSHRVRRLHRGLEPAWSPDGQRLVFVEHGALFVMHRDGSHVVHLVG